MIFENQNTLKIFIRFFILGAYIAHLIVFYKLI